MYKIYFIYFFKYQCDSTDKYSVILQIFYKTLFHIIDTYTCQKINKTLTNGEKMWYNLDIDVEKGGKCYEQNKCISK